MTAMLEREEAVGKLTALKPLVRAVADDQWTEAPTILWDTLDALPLALREWAMGDDKEDK
jgi:hypothetical protein